VPKAPEPVRIAVLLYPRCSLSLALLARDLFGSANRVLGAERFVTQLTTAGRARRFECGDLTVRVEPPQPGLRYLIVPPTGGFEPSHLESWQNEVRLLARLSRQGTTVATACLGALMAASAGLLAGRTATTHWRWAAFAAERFPAVEWAPSEMICDAGAVITAGGYLALVDLVLHLVARCTSARQAHDLGQVLLADSIRQRQSVYARTLVAARSEDSRMARVESWVRRHLDGPLRVDEMALAAGQSLRSFHRHFRAAYGVTPNQYVQLKRVERAQELLRDSSLSVDEIVAKLGVTDVTSFRRLFRRELGLTPREFRARIGGPR